MFLKNSETICILEIFHRALKLSVFVLRGEPRYQ